MYDVGSSRGRGIVGPPVGVALPRNLAARPILDHGQKSARTLEQL